MSKNTELNQIVTVFGAYGHTGRFVVSELSKRGWNAILSGRDSNKLQTLVQQYGDFEMRPASIDDTENYEKLILEFRLSRNLGVRRIQAELIRHHDFKLSTKTIEKVPRQNDVPPLRRSKNLKKFQLYRQPIPLISDIKLTRHSHCYYLV